MLRIGGQSSEPKRRILKGTPARSWNTALTLDGISNRIRSTGLCFTDRAAYPQTLQGLLPPLPLPDPSQQMAAAATGTQGSLKELPQGLLQPLLWATDGQETPDNPPAGPLLMIKVHISAIGTAGSGTERTHGIHEHKTVGMAALWFIRRPGIRHPSAPPILGATLTIPQQCPPGQTDVNNVCFFIFRGGTHYFCTRIVSVNKLYILWQSIIYFHFYQPFNCVDLYFVPARKWYWQFDSVKACIISSPVQKCYSAQMNMQNISTMMLYSFCQEAA